MNRPFTGDPLSACCGDPGDCSQAHLYCFNRKPKEANVAAMQDHQKGVDGFDVIGPINSLARIDAMAHAQCVLPPTGTWPRTEKPAQQKINEATHGSTLGLDKVREGIAKIDQHIARMEANLLSEDSAARKGIPIATGVLDYFPLALAAVARLSKIGNDKHNPGEPLHWSRGKSDDHADTIMRHMIDRGKLDTDGELHDAKVAWRALAMLQIAEEKRLSST